MKRILGLDLGVASIGWSVIDVPQPDTIGNGEKHTPEETPGSKAHITISPNTNSEISITGMGCILISNSSDTLRDFQKGVGENANTHRKHLRSQRNRIRHAKIRRFRLQSFLKEYQLFPRRMEYSKLRLWEFRALAARERLELEDLGRVLIHLSKKRGHVSGIKVEPQGKTIGEYVFGQISQDSNFRAKGLEFSRMEHLRELETIINCQKKFYPEIFTLENSYRLTHRIIFKDNRRKDKAATKRLCEVETKEHLKSLHPSPNKHQKKYSPTAALRSNPLYQNFSTLCQIQNIRVYGDKELPQRSLTLNEQIELFNYLQVNDSITVKKIPGLLGLDNGVHCKTVLPYGDLPIRVSTYRRKITGNQTYAVLYNILGDKYLHLLKFDIPPSKPDPNIHLNPGDQYNCQYNHTCQYTNVHSQDKHNKAESALSLSFKENTILEQPLYGLWRDIFSVRDKKALRKVLQRKYNIEEEDILDRLCIVNFYSYGFSNISLKAIRSLMPFMLQGKTLMEAFRLAGYVKMDDFGDTCGHDTLAVPDYKAPHPFSSNILSDSPKIPSEQKLIPPLKDRNLIHPVVEKVLSKLITLVNKLISQYGLFDSIHIELARELWMSAFERKRYYCQNLQNQQDYLRYTKELLSLGIPVSQKALTKFKIWEESDGCCIYCGKGPPIKDYLTSQVGEVEHIIPRSKQFNDSISNKACSCRNCNKAKGSMTAYDYMASQGEKTLKEYNLRIDSLYLKKKISKAKHENLLTKADELSDQFISAQLAASRYIASKAQEILRGICPEVIPTNGIFTSFLRNKWEYDSILHDLNLPFYRAISKVDLRLCNDGSKIDGNKEVKEKIRDWSKRLDHRNHCLDALVIALTSKDFIDGVYGMRSTGLRQAKPTNTGTEFKQVSSDKLALSQPRVGLSQVREALGKIIVVHPKQDDKVRWSYRNNELGHIRTLTPKGALHRQSLYGEIIRFNDKGKPSKMKVIRVPIEEIDTEKLAGHVVDPTLRSLIKARLEGLKQRKEEVTENKEEAQSLTPSVEIYSDKAYTQKVRSVRRFSYHQNLHPLRFNQNGEAQCYVRTDNNHHISLYRLPSGKTMEKVVSFFDYALLRRLRLNGVIVDPASQHEATYERNIILDETLQKCMPPKDALHILTLMKNQLYILGLTDEQISNAFEKNDIAFLSHHLYRVQGISAFNYRFALHTQSETALKNFNKPDGRFLLYSSLSKFLAANPRRVIVDILGRIKLL